MSIEVTGVYIVSAKRTPFGKFGGALKNTTGSELQIAACRAALEAGNIKPDYIDTVNIGNVFNCAQSDGIYLPRHVSLKLGIPLDRPALGVNRLCGSGFQSIVNGANDIMLGAADISLTGGVENLSQYPFILRDVRFGISMGTKSNLEDSLCSCLFDTYCNASMAMTAENLADEYKISREEIDKFALRSQQLWKKGYDEGAFKAEITPIKIKVKGKEIDFAVDEHPRPESTLEGLAKLPSLFKNNGIVTAGTASGICDGAASVILASESALLKYNLKPLSKLIGYSIVGCRPDIMGIGPVTAIQNILKTNSMKMDEIDLFEINEAFSGQTLACLKELNIPMEKFNLNGGAIAMGHPFAATGGRITAHLVHELKRKNLKYGIGATCIGGGQGIAILLENC